MTMRKNESKIRNKVYRLKRESALLGLILCFAISNTTIKGQKLAFKQGVTEELKATDRLAGKKYSCKERVFFSTVSDGERVKRYPSKTI
jgi:hypothetical protein